VTDHKYEALATLAELTVEIRTEQDRHEQLVIDALNAGCSLRATALAAGVTAPTVAAIRDRHRG